MTLGRDHYPSRRSLVSAARAILILFLVAFPNVAWTQTDSIDLTTPLAPPASDPKTDAEVRELTRRGIKEARNGNIEAAREAFARAWSLSADAEVAALLARIEMKLGRYREAAEHWDFYVQTLPPDRATAVEKLAECRQHIGSLRVSTDPAGAVISIDGRAIPGALRSDEVWLDPGKHTLSAELDGRTSPEHTITIAAGEAQTVTLVLPPPRPQPSMEPLFSLARPPPPPPDEPGLSTRTIVLIGGSVLTAAALGTGIVFTVKSNAAADRADELRRSAEAKVDPELVERSSFCALPPDERPSECAELHDATTEKDHARDVAVVSYIAAGVLGLGTTAAYFLWPEASRPSQSSAGFVVAPFAGGRGVQLRVRF